MQPMRRIAAAFAVVALVRATAFPALAALCCASPPSHACCAKGQDPGTAVEHAPCCKMDAAAGAAREPVLPRASSRTDFAFLAVAQPLGHPALLTADAPAPARRLLPASPPLGPPLRLRI